MISDLINGLMETVGGLFVLNHGRILYKEKSVKGVSKITLIFFICWGLFNLYFYGNLNQIYSLFGAIFMCICNIIHTSMVIYYSRKSKNDQ